MSLYNDDRYTWRETYFVLFDDHRRRPMLDELRRELHRGSLKILDGTTNAEGRLRSLIVASYEDHSALEIVFRQGPEVIAETNALVQTLEQGSTPKEKERLRSVTQWPCKFDVLHFEQTAGTAEFKVVKLPVLKFQQPSSETDRRDSFSTKRQTDRLNEKAKFQFDPNSYENCLAGGSGEEYAREIDRLEAEREESGIYERVDPDTLILVLETLCRLTNGVAIDPASGVIIEN
jgi:hypothetical protein